MEPESGRFGKIGKTKTAGGPTRNRGEDVANRRHLLFLCQFPLEEAFYSGKGRSSAEDPAPEAGAAGDAATLMKLLTNPETAGLLKALVNAMGNEESK